MRHRPLVFAMAAFMLLIVTAHMQEIGGQTAELPARPWWHCGYYVTFPHEYGGLSGYMFHAVGRRVG